MTTRALGALLVVLALAAGCGDQGGGASSASPTTGTPSTAGEPWREIAIVTGTAAGGEVSSEPVRVDTQDAMVGFVGQFERSDLADKVVAAVRGAEPPTGWVPVAVVISIGCDVPPGVDVRVLDGGTDDGTDGRASGLAITAQKVPKPMRECFAAMTSVAVLVVDPVVL